MKFQLFDLYCWTQNTLSVWDGPLGKTCQEIVGEIVCGDIFMAIEEREGSDIGATIKELKVAIATADGCVGWIVYYPNMLIKPAVKCVEGDSSYALATA